MKLGRDFGSPKMDLLRGVDPLSVRSVRDNSFSQKEASISSAEVICYFRLSVFADRKIALSDISVFVYGGHLTK